MKKLFVFAVAIAGILSIASLASAQPAVNAFYVDGEFYRTVGTPTNLPEQGPFDGIFVLNGLDGQRPVAEAKPGDQDFNGGRWQVYVAEFTEAGIAAHDTNGDGVIDTSLKSWEEVQTMLSNGHLNFVGTGPRFVCPVIHQ